MPTERADAEKAVSDFLNWFDGLRLRLNEAITESALGTGYEVSLRIQVYQRLGIHPIAGERILPREINLLPAPKAPQP